MITRTLTVLTTILSAAAFAYGGTPPIDDPTALKDLRVAPISGSVVLTRNDLKSTQGTWSLRRTYTPGLGQVHNFGSNWVSLLDARVRVVDAQRVLVLDALGSPRVFVLKDSGVYAAESGMPATLQISASCMLLAEAGSEQEFDAQGALVRWTSERGTLHVHRNPAGIATRIQTPEGSVELLRNGKRLTGVRAPEGTVRYERDKAGNIVKAIRPGSSERYAYDAQGRLSHVGGDRVQLSYDAEGRVTSLTRAGSPDVTYAYGEREQTRTMGGQDVVLRLSEDERQLVESNGDMALTTVFDDRNRPLKVTRGEHAVQTLGYDAEGRLVQVGPTTLRYLDSDTLPDVTVAHDGTQTRYRYDGFGRVVLRQRGEQSFAISYEGSTTRMQAPNGAQLTRTRAATSSHLVQTSPAGAVMKETNFDALGRAVERHERGQARRFLSYGSDGRVSEVHGPQGLIARFAYDAEGQPLAVEDALGNRATCDYSEGQRVLDGPTNGQRVQSFDANGRLLSEVAGGVETRYVYDEAGRVVRRVSGERSERFRYDAKGRLLSMEGPDGGLSYAYDEAGRVAKLTHEPLGQSVEYRYDDAGRRAAVVLPWGTIRYERDGEGQLSAVESPQGRVEFEHNAQGQRTLVRYPNGAVTRYAYSDGRLDSIETRQGDDVLVRQAYRYGSKGQISRIEGLADESTSFAFDVEGRLTRAGSEHFGYDVAGNRVRVAEGETEALSTFGAGNRLLTAGDLSFEHDSSGRLIRSGSEDEAARYDYDARGRLSAVHTADGQTVSYGYAPNGQLLWREDAAGRTSFLSGLEGTYGEFSEGAVQQAFVLGEGLDDVLAVEREGESFFFHTDRVRSVLAMTGPQGEVAARYRYSAFGAQLEQSGPASEWNHLGFTSRPQDPASGLVDMRARSYDPQLGRFLTPDPLAHQGGMNLYSYVGNNPLKYRDPLGLDDDDPFPNPFKDLGNDGIGLIGGIIGGIAEGVENAYNDGKEWVENAQEDVTEWVDNAQEDVTEWANNAWDDVTNTWNNGVDWVNNTAWPWIRDDGIPTAVGIGIFVAGISNPITAPYAYAWLDREFGISRAVAQFFDREIGFEVDAFMDYLNTLPEEARAAALAALGGVASDGYSSEKLPFKDFADLEQLVVGLELLSVIKHTNDSIARGTIEKALVSDLENLTGQLSSAEAKAFVASMIAAYEVLETKNDPTWYPGKDGNYSSAPTISETAYDMPALVSMLKGKATAIGAIPAYGQDSWNRTTANQTAFNSRFPGLSSAATASE